MKYAIVDANGKIQGRCLYASVDNAMKRIMALQFSRGVRLYYKKLQG